MGSSSRNVERWSGNRWIDEGVVNSQFSSNHGESFGTNQARIIEGRPEKRDQYNQGRVTSHKSHSVNDNNRRPKYDENSDQNRKASNSKNIHKYVPKDTIHIHNQKNTNKKKESLNHRNKDTQHDSVNVMYRCKICNNYLRTRYNCTQHRDEHHAKLLGHPIFEKVPIRIEKPMPLHVGKKISGSRNIPVVSMTSEPRQKYCKDAKVNANKRLQEKKLSFVFICDVCNVILINIYASRKHRYTQHSNLDKNKKLFTKLPVEDGGSTSAVEPERKKKVDDAGEGGTAKSRKTFHKSKDSAQGERKPVSTLYQCFVCNVFFTSEKEAMGHTAVCTKDITDINVICCQICEKPFLREDLKVHRDRDHLPPGQNNEINITRIRALKSRMTCLTSGNNWLQLL